nr:Ger(x)C family spore germination protein [Lysinibacillus timonensis]
MKNSREHLHIIFFILLSLFTFLLSACSFKEIDKHAFVSAIGIDTTGDETKPYNVTLKVFNPTSSIKESGEPNYTFISEEGESLTEAIRILETNIDKKLDFGHLKAIVLGEDSVKEHNMDDLLDFLTRRPDIQLIAWVLVARPNAEEIIKMIPKTETAAYPALYNFFDQNANESPYVVTTFLFEFRRQITELGVDPVLPIVESKEEEYKINKSMVIAEDGHPVELDPLETQLFNLIKNEVSSANLKVGGKDDFFMIEADRFKKNYQPEISPDGSLSLKLEFSFKGMIVESSTEMHLNQLPQYNERAEKEGTKTLTDLLTKLRDEGIDPIGFGVRYRTTVLHNQLMSYDEWMKLYEDAKIDVKINADLKGTGLLG